MAAEAEHPQTDPLRAMLDALERDARDEVRDQIAALHPADIAHLLEGIPGDQRQTVWRLLPPPVQGEVLLEVADAVRDDLLEEMDSQAVIQAVRELDTDDLADLIPHLPDELVTELLFTLEREDRQRLDRVLSYPEDSAGGLMDVDVVAIRENVTLEVVLRYLRRLGELPEGTNQIFVVDWSHRLVGSLPLRRLVTQDPRRRVYEVMEREITHFTPLTPEEKVAEAFERYNLISAPVVDDHGRLLGRITVDDVVDVIRDQADQAVLAHAGLSEEEDIFAPVPETTRNRAVWLGVNLLTAFLASWVIGHFEATITKVVALAVLMPIVASMGGNAGTQTLTVTIRGLALGTITPANALLVLRKELLVGGLNGLIWAVVVASVATLWYRDIGLGLIIAVAMIINLLCAALAGVALPLVFKRLGIDPALAGGVALTTLTDVVGFLSFLGLAALLLT